MKSGAQYILIFFTGLFFPVAGFSQTYSIQGKVAEETSGESLEGATIAIHETQSGTITGKGGSYVLSNLKKGTYHLHVSFVGYESKTKTVKVSGDVEGVDFHLKKSSLEIKEFVIKAEPYKSGEEEISQTVEVAGEEFLAKNKGTNLAQSLDKMPGMDVISVGTGIAKPVLRGFSSNRLSVAENGVKQEGQQWGAEHGLEIDQYGVGQVEVVKGPSSVIYGSDAIGGVINIRPPEVPKRNTLKGGVLLDGQSNTMMGGGSASLSGNKEGKFFRLRYSAKDYGDYKVPADSFNYNRFLFPLHDQTLKNTAGKEESYSGTVGISENWGISRLSISNFQQLAGFFPGAHGRPNEESLQPDGEDRNIEVPRQTINHFKVLSNTNILFRENWLEMDLGYQYNLRKEFDEVPDEPALQLDLQTYSANIHYHHHINELWNSVYGVSGSFQQNKRSGSQFLIPDHAGWEGGVFSVLEYRITEKMTTNAGLRFDIGQKDIEAFSVPVYDDQDNLIDYEIKTPEIHRTFSSLAGGVGLSYYPSHHFNLKVNTGSSFRYPTVAELASNGVHHGAFRYEKGDAALAPERSYQLDVNLTYHRENYYFKLTPYFNYFRDYIYLNPTGYFAPKGSGGGQVYQYSQANAIHTGSELSLDYHLLEQLHMEVVADYVFAFNLESGYPLPAIPPLSANVDVEYALDSLVKKLKGTYISLGTKLAAPQNLTERNELKTPGYVIFNFSAGTSIPLKKRNLKLFFQIKNLADAKYFHHLSRYRIINLPEPGRNFVILLSVPLFTINLEKNETQ